MSNFNTVAMINQAIESLELSPEANSFALDIFALAQVFDDIQDGDSVKSYEFERAIRAAFITLPVNPIYQRHQSLFAPVLMLCIEKWKAANEAEKTGAHDARSFMWRAGLYDVFALLCLIEGKSAIDALRLYGEKFEDYMKEFQNA